MWKTTSDQFTTRKGSHTHPRFTLTAEYMCYSFTCTALIVAAVEHATNVWHSMRNSNPYRTCVLAHNQIRRARAPFHAAEYHRVAKLPMPWRTQRETENESCRRILRNRIILSINKAYSVGRAHVRCSHQASWFALRLYSFQYTYRA